jgi:hypothetical protein
MKRLVVGTCVLGALLVVANFGRSDEEKDLRAVIARALEVNGGADKLAKYLAHTMKSNGKFYGLGEAIDFTMDIAAQEKQFRFSMQMTVMGFDLKVTSAVNGDKGWEKVNDDIKDMPADELAEHKEQMHAQAVAGLLPLKNKDYKLAALGDVKVGDQFVTGVRVSKDGRRDVNLFFDKAKGHLAKSEFIVKDIKGSGDKEITQTNFYSDYKEFQGIRHPTHLIIERDGKKFVDAQMTEIQLFEKLDDNVFDRP